jgi:PAS domain S-box-containing protein
MPDGTRGAIVTDLAERVRLREILASREWLRVTLSSIGDAVLCCDADGRIAFINPVAEALTGWSERDALGQPMQRVFRLVNELTHEPAEDPVARVLRDGTLVTLTNHTALVARDGREVSIEDSAAPIKDAAGNLAGAVVVFHDVGEQRAAERTLRQALVDLEAANGAVEVCRSDIDARRAISRALVELHGGTIEAQSDGRDKGATFRVRLPLLSVEPGAAQATAVAEMPEAPMPKLRVLVVDDHDDTVEMLKIVLESEGHEVRTASDVATALETAAQVEFDLLLSDLGLPDGSGLDLMRELRARGSTLPGIALSGYGQASDVAQSLSAGFSEHVVKPPDPYLLLQTMEKVVRRSGVSGATTRACDRPTRCGTS